MPNCTNAQMPKCPPTSKPFAPQYDCVWFWLWFWYLQYDTVGTSGSENFSFLDDDSSAGDMEALEVDQIDLGDAAADQNAADGA